MDKILHIAHFDIVVGFYQKSIHLKSNYQLEKLTDEGWQFVEQLAEFILHEYEILFNQSLLISKNSLTIEILAHVYTYRICRTIRKVFPKGIFRLISYRSCNIECGEKCRDHNRWVWDFLSWFHPLIFLMVKRKK